jgi:hypothetical protein
MKREDEKMEQVREIEYLGTIMHHINPTPCPYLRVTWICTLGHVGCGNRCGGDTLLRVTMTHWLVGL